MLNVHPHERAHTWRGLFAPIAISAVCLAMLGCRQPAAPTQTAAVVGAWFVTIPEAPFPYHLFVFHSDGTVVQSNPDAGDAHTSDSSLIGAWIAEGDHIRGKLIETSADRATHKFVGRIEISFSLKVSGDVFNGPASAEFFDAVNHPTGGLHATFTGRRIVP